jgi:hypothetical protein
MSELSREARALLDLSADQHDPTAADKARVREALRACISAPSPRSGVSAHLTKILVALMSVGTLLVAGRIAVRTMPAEPPVVVERAPGMAPVAPREPVERIAEGSSQSRLEERVPVLERKMRRAARKPTRAMAAAPHANADVEESSAAAQSPASSMTSELGAQAEHVVESTGVASPAREGSVAPSAPRPTSCALDDELQSLTQARRALPKPARALALLRAYEARCPSGALVLERKAIEAIALCTSGRLAEGRKIRAQMEEEAPNSPSLSKVRSTCDGP